MATWTAFSGTANASWAFDGLGSIDSVHSTSTRLIFNNGDGTLTYLNGTGLTVSNDPTWTTLTSVDHVAADGTTVLESITNITLGYQAGHFFTGILAGNDSIVGSSGADHIWGHTGDDTITGGGGADALNGGGGNDVFILDAGDFAAGESITDNGAGIIDLENAGSVDFSTGTFSGISTVKFGSGVSSATFDSGQPVHAGTLEINTFIGSAQADTVTFKNAYSDFSHLTFTSWTAGVDTINFITNNGNFGSLVGTNQNDTMTLNGGGNVQGGTGDDTFIYNATSAGGDLDGGAGNDTIELESANITYGDGRLTNVERLVFLSGNSTITFLGNTLVTAVPTIIGSAGTDKIVINSSQTNLSGVSFSSWTAGVDSITINVSYYGVTSTAIGSSQADLINGSVGADQISAGGGNDTIAGNTGNGIGHLCRDAATGAATRSATRAARSVEHLQFADMTLNASDVPINSTGTAGNDLIYGGGGNDTLSGLAGNDVLVGLGGDDVGYGGDGNDYFYAGAGNDVLFGGNGLDVLLGEAGNDSIYGGSGFNYLFGGDGNDILVGSGGTASSDVNVMFGGNGGDDLYGGLGTNYFYGGAGVDTMFGGSGENIFISSGETDGNYIYGGSGQNYVYGSNGGDTVSGGSGVDVFLMGSGADVISGGGGVDYAWGGGGSDTFMINDTTSEVMVIQDFNAGGVNDVVNFAGTSLHSFADLQAAEFYSPGINTTIITDAAGNAAWLIGVAPGQLDASMFRLT
ncbi:calcium-binding protein [Bradyrhizobium sp. th.b2]|uniref:calcium-binding protein n=1 Tax=Bradyrhizobium sp. th-b2 TaxID=172088 RepID=UPI0003FAA33F|nr:calcium-binding protein [Bradyrhizobium sp. th.b2]